MKIPDLTIFALSRVTGVTATPPTTDQRSNEFATAAMTCRDEPGVRILLTVDGLRVFARRAPSRMLIGGDQ